jgi:hypothetical protein
MTTTTTTTTCTSADVSRAAAAHRALRQVSELHGLVTEQIDAERDATSDTDKAILNTRIAKTFARIAAAYRRSAAAGGRRFFIGQQPGSGDRERAAANRADADAAHHREVARFYRGA